MNFGPLGGWTIGVTADRRAAEQAELIERRGGRVVHTPTIRTLALELDDRVADAIADAICHPPDVVVLSTGVGTRALFDAAECLGLGDELRGAFRSAAVIVRGPKAHGAAVTAGLDVVWQAPNSTSAELVAHLDHEGIAGARVAVQLDGQDLPRLAQAIHGLGADVVAMPVYRWTHPADVVSVGRLIDVICDDRLDAVTFTSAPALLNLLEVAQDRDRTHDVLRALNGPVATVSIGPVCSATARSVGIEPAVEPRRPRLGSMVMTLADHAVSLRERSTRRIGLRRVELRACTVAVDGHVIAVPPREHATLRMLVDNAGSVVAKDRLRHPSSAATPDDHAVEVTIARLRRRLGPRLSIRAVPRRGYLLTA